MKLYEAPSRLNPAGVEGSKLKAMLLVLIELTDSSVNVQANLMDRPVSIARWCLMSSGRSGRCHHMAQPTWHCPRGSSTLDSSPGCLEFWPNIRKVISREAQAGRERHQNSSAAFSSGLLWGQLQIPSGCRPHLIPILLSGTVRLCGHMKSGDVAHTETRLKDLLPAIRRP